MITDFTLIESDESVCEEVVLASIASYWGRRYEMIYSEMWNFKLVNTEKPFATIGEMLEIKTGDILELLEKYHGITTVTNVIDNPNEREKHVKEWIAQGHIVCSFLKKEKVCWATEGKDTDYFPFIIMGFEADKVRCMDVHFIKQEVEFPINAFFQDTSKYMVFSYVPDYEYTTNWKAVLQHNVTQLEENQAFESLKEVSRMIRKNPKLVSDEDYRNNWKNIGFCVKLKDLCRTRALFAEMIRYLNKYQNARIPDEIEQKFIEVSNQWMTLWSTCVKSTIRKGVNIPIERIAGKFEEIGVLEYELCKKVKELISA